MATVQELTDENIALKTQIADLRVELTRYKAATVAVEGILHHVDVHDSTAEDLRDAIVTFKAKRAIANTIPVLKEPEVIE